VRGTEAWLTYAHAFMEEHGRLADEIVRFSRFINKTDSCWLWTGSKNITGYGKFYCKGKDFLAHRFSFSVAHGITLLPEQILLHSCDNPACVRPSHLTVGTHADNVADSLAKGRRYFQKQQSRYIKEGFFADVG
jgi:hypothetical protein